MPKTYDLDFVDHLLKAIDFFELENEFDIKESIHKSICQKFVEEPSNNFHSVLQFLSTAIKHDFDCLCNMCSALIANKFYHKWEETFPSNEPSNNFHSVLQFLSTAIKHDFDCLCNMCSALIANKFYHKWEEAFPSNTRNPNNLLFLEIFGPEGHIDLENQKSLTFRSFKLIEFAFVNSFFTNTILQ
uniref:Uncharacterized protein n=1 Tax=Panagrolaimus sp. PS1159 TaxID=55785 RepID=A0AC35FFL5_9BILA